MEFIYENSGSNTYLVYALSNGQELDDMCLGTLKANRIPGYAPVTFKTLDDNKFIRYNITSKISVEELFRGTVNKKMMLAILKGVVNALLITDEYIFLDQKSLVLDSRYIFIDCATYETDVICLPLERDSDGEVNVRSFLKGLVTDATTDVDDDQYITTLLRFMNKSPKLSLIEMRELLEELSGPTGPVVVPKNPVAKQEVMVQTPPQSVPATPSAMNYPGERSYVQGNGNRPDHVKPPIAQRQDQDKDRSEKLTNLKQHFGEKGFGRTDGKAPAAEADGGIKGIFSGFFGGKKEEKSVNAEKLPTKHISAENMPSKIGGKAGRLPVGDNRSVNIPRAPGTGNAPIPAMEKNENKKTGVPGGQPSIGGVQMPVNMPPKVESKPQQPANPPRVDTNFPGTMVLQGAAPGTQILETANQKYPYLVYLKTKEKIMLDKPVFIIGKESSQVHYTIVGNGTVSRTHAKIYTEGNKYLLEDANSLNHTYINRKMIPSSVKTPIKHGDRLTFSNEEFEFRTH